MERIFSASRCAMGVPVSTERFGAMMELELVNQESATFVLDLAPGTTRLR